MGATKRTGQYILLEFETEKRILRYMIQVWGGLTMRDCGELSEALDAFYRVLPRTEDRVLDILIDALDKVGWTYMFTRFTQANYTIGKFVRRINVKICDEEQYSDREAELYTVKLHDFTECFAQYLRFDDGTLMKYNAETVSLKTECLWNGAYLYTGNILKTKQGTGVVAYNEQTDDFYTVMIEFYNHRTAPFQESTSEEILGLFRLRIFNVLRNMGYTADAMLNNEFFLDLLDFGRTLRTYYQNRCGTGELSVVGNQDYISYAMRVMPAFARAFAADRTLDAFYKPLNGRNGVLFHW